MRKAKPIMPIIGDLKDLMDYNQDTGLFTYKDGRVAGCVGTRGYRILTLNKVRYPAHRVAWVWVYNEEAPSEIDHIDGDRSNNRPENLRRGDKGVNQANVPPRSVTGITGVAWLRVRKRFRATLGRGDNYQLFYYGEDFFEACCARKSAENKLWAAQ